LSTQLGIQTTNTQRWYFDFLPQAAFRQWQWQKSGKFGTSRGVEAVSLMTDSDGDEGLCDERRSCSDQLSVVGCGRLC
ncbi:hypothetical protein B0T09DRAFT_254239, partial [Sordaria sp. MPI-SDFR-AT-0083]